MALLVFALANMEHPRAVGAGRCGLCAEVAGACRGTGCGEVVTGRSIQTQR